VNLDLNLICDYPKISPIRQKILMEISTLMNININKLSLKGTSTEDQGFINTKNGIAAQAIISIEVPKYER
jgi:2-C-methyl-D-erythritol 4-phosphate cytidylyltransferase/2-C-methyl-D-erythritol 2,4-cyclodiphosphate synthase